MINFLEVGCGLMMYKMPSVSFSDYDNLETSPFSTLCQLTYKFNRIIDFIEGPNWCRTNVCNEMIYVILNIAYLETSYLFSSLQNKNDK